jgi:aspartate racemase
MKTIGLIGGMSWESTVEYYRLINQAAKDELGGLHSAKCILHSVDFAEVAELQRRGNWPAAAQMLVAAAQGLEKAGADFVLICTNTMHKVASTVQAGIGIPLLHIADATAKKVTEAGMRQVGLLGTRFTMEEEFYRGRLADQFGLEVIIPNLKDREAVHHIIYKELCVGAIKPESKTQLQDIVARLREMGAEGVILGCTELGLLLKNGDGCVPIFDTTYHHAMAAVELAFE